MFQPLRFVVDPIPCYAENLRLHLLDQVVANYGVLR